MFKKPTRGRLMERRRKPRDQDLLYRLVVGVNIVGWLILVIALMTFHFARPEFVSGVQSYWGIEGRTEWAPEYLHMLLNLLRLCLALSLICMIIKAKRNRRRQDYFGINLFVLAGVCLLGLLTLSFQLG